MVDGGEVQHHQRAVQAEAGVVGPSNIPHRSPWTSRRSSRATSRPSSNRSARDVRRASEASKPGSRSASTTWGRVGAGIRARWARSVASPRAASMAARSRGRRSRPRQATASEEVRTTRRRRTPSPGSDPRASASSSVSSGLSRTAPPGRRATGRTSQARASGPYSPFGSTTQACRPKTAWRQRYDFTNELLPRPIWPNTTALGLVTTPWR